MFCQVAVNTLAMINIHDLVVFVGYIITQSLSVIIVKLQLNKNIDVFIVSLELRFASPQLFKKINVSSCLMSPDHENRSETKPL